MKKILNLENLDCASCASKMESAIKKLDGVKEVSVNFILQKIKLEVDEERYNTILIEIKKICKKIEPDCKILDK